MSEKRVWLLFTSKEAKSKAAHILKESGYLLPSCGEGFSVLKSNLAGIDRDLRKAGFDMNTRYVQML